MSLLLHVMVPLPLPFPLYVITALYLCCQPFYVVVVAYRLVVGARGYIEYSFGMLRCINAPQARDGGWIWKEVHGGRGDLL